MRRFGKPPRFRKTRRMRDKTVPIVAVVTQKTARAFDPSMMLGSVPLLLDFFAVAVGVNHGKDKEHKPADHQHNEDGLMLPDVADEL
jgi:hypothetical protein